ncbi:NucA/NucB deoxyribonuclease domain-containing protein [Paenibacillus polymyxa]|uniref:NucA/NucB deoxyribonuclease domain-containing protein n=2 Tax=Paenibacillus polymyxa TaxID=1406 RepID=UPI0025B6F714|nr:NucA/NucB deoxyribonuclease domain-containing protein [Paenibacillus polymyxa]MDN4111890.1 NucA/NucB deoxyribonuclease domain-containing protein [Paenibacillus polymyxa]
MRKTCITICLLGALIVLGGFINTLSHTEWGDTKPSVQTVAPVATTTAPGEAVRLEFPSDRYPETAQHIKEAIAAGKSPVCTIDREGADHNRDLSLKGVPTKKGKDRDEWPMAMCAEGGEGADIKYISPKDNRGAGSWVGHKLDEYKDGTKVEFIVK